MVHDEQRHALDLGRREEPKNGLAAPVRSEPHEQPSLVGDLPFAVEHLQKPFVSLRFRFGPMLRFLDNLSRVRLGVEPRDRKDRGDRQR